MTEEQVPINQTQFSFEEPIFEDQAVYEDEKPVVDLKPHPKKNKKIVIILVGVGVFLLILATIIFLSMRNRTDEVVDAEPETAITKELGPIQKRIEDARALLDLADPSKQDLVFPPVNLEIRLDPKE